MAQNFPSLSIGPVPLHLMVVGYVFFPFYSNFNRTFCLANSEHPDHSAASDLDLQRLCMSHKKVARLIWVNNHG